MAKLLWFGGSRAPTFRTQLPSGCRDPWSKGNVSIRFAALSLLWAVCLQAAQGWARFSLACMHPCSISTSRDVETGGVSRTAPFARVCRVSITRSGDDGLRRRLWIRWQTAPLRPWFRLARSCQRPTRNQTARKYKTCLHSTSLRLLFVRCLLRPTPPSRQQNRRPSRQQNRPPSRQRRRRLSRHHHPLRHPKTTISLDRVRPLPARPSWPPLPPLPARVVPRSRFASPAGW